MVEWEAEERDRGEGRQEGGGDNAWMRGYDSERRVSPNSSCYPDRGLEGLLTTALCLTAPLTPPPWILHYRTTGLLVFPPTECWAEQRWGSHVQPDPPVVGVQAHIWAEQLTLQTSLHTMWGPDWFIGEGGVFNKLHHWKRRFACIYATFLSR